MNDFSRSLLSSYAWAVAPRPAFSGLRAAAGGALWSGYILYTGDTDTFRYRYNQVSGGVGATIIKVNGTTVHTNSAGNGVSAGTVSIAGLGLTAGEVYAVTVTNAGGTTDPYWLGLSQTINYTTPPTFTTPLTDTLLNTLRTGLTELESAWAMPHTPSILARLGTPGPGKGYPLDGTPQVVWRGFFYHAHNTLRYRIRHGISDKAVLTKIYYNAVDLTGTDLEDYSHDIERSGTYTLTGLTRGTVYECYVTLSRTGTSATVGGFLHVLEISEASGVTITPPPVWAHGGTNITNTNMNRYSTAINTIHPGAASPTAPLYYEQPALQTDTSGYRYYIQHRRKWLRYRVRQDVANKTVEVYYGPNLANRHALPSSVGNQSFDMTTLPGGLGLGQFYLVEDVEFACEYDTAQG